jgi:hypothetical protein
MAITYVPVVGFFAPDGLALPATQLIEDGGASAPIGVFPPMREPCRNLIPPVRRLCPLQLKGLGDRLTGNRELQGEAPGVQRGLGAWGTRLLRAGLHVGVCASRAARVEARSEACKRVFRVHGCSASIASSRLTDLSNRMLSSTSHRPR